MAGYIEVNGIELIAIIKLLKETVDVELYPKITYFVPFEEAEKMLAALKELQR